MPRKTRPKVVADRLCTVIALLGMAMASFGDGGLRVLGIVAVVGAVGWYATVGIHLGDSEGDLPPR